jgi:hypothetical protein
MSRSPSLYLLASSLALLASWRLPLAAQTVYACVWGHPKFVVGSSTLHSGLYRTTDGGGTWTHLGPQNLKTFSMDAVDATKGRVLYIAAGNGVHRSLDSGRTWKIVTDWRVTEVLDVVVDQREPHRIYAGTAYGLWISEDYGDTWSATPVRAFVERVEIADSVLRLYVDDVPPRDGLDTTTRSLAMWSVAKRAGTPRELDQMRSPAIASGRIMIGPRQRIDSTVMHGSPVRTPNGTLVGTWGNGVYRIENGRWVQSGLEGSQVWRLVAKEY